MVVGYFSHDAMVRILMYLHFLFFFFNVLHDFFLSCRCNLNTYSF